MAATVLTVLLSIVVGGLLLLLIGPKINVGDDEQSRQLTNFIIYVLAAAPIIFLIVFFLVERL